MHPLEQVSDLPYCKVQEKLGPLGVPGANPPEKALADLLLGNRLRSLPFLEPFT